MAKSKIIVATLAVLLFQACKPKHPARPSEYYNNTEDGSIESTIYVPLNIYKAELEKSINSQLGDVLFKDDNLADDGLMLKATRHDDIRISMDSQMINYVVPVDLWIKKDLAIANVVAEGSLELTFRTAYQVRPDWSLQTQTELIEYQWTKEPALKLGFASLPITSIADSFLRKSKAEIAASIDEQVAGFLDLRTEMETVWQELHEPVLVSEDYAAWLSLNPQSIGMTPMASSESLVQSTIVIHSSPRITLGEKPATPTVSAMPDFKFASDEGDEFQLNIRTEIPFAEAERISNEMMDGEVFDYGKKKVVVENIEIYGQGNKLVVNTKLSGDYNGNVYFTGKPEYNERKNQIELEKVDFDFNSKKALLKTASWLFKGAFKRKVQESLNYYLNYNLEDTQNYIRQELKDYLLAPGIRLSGDLYDLNVSHVYIAVEAIRVEIGLRGRLNVEVKSLGF